MDRGRLRGDFVAAEYLMNSSIGLRRFWAHERRPGSRQFGGLQSLSYSGVRSVNGHGLLLELRHWHGWAQAAPVPLGGARCEPVLLDGPVAEALAFGVRKLSDSP